MSSRANFRAARHAQAGHGGFSLIELLVAVALAACVTTTAVMIYQNLAASGGTRSVYGTVTVGAPLANFYGVTATAIDTYFAPNYGCAAQAEIVRDQFITDLQKASAVFCLGRNGVNTIRPTTITVAPTFRGDSLGMPDDFRALIDPGGNTFLPYRGASYATNASIFMLRPSTDATTLQVLAIYDIDLTATASPPGTYASVKRYVNGTLDRENYYDVFYPHSEGTLAFNPLIVCFERSGRWSHVEGDSIDRLKQAAQRPFYFVWWPDPSAHTLEAFTSSEGSPTATDPRASYPNMGGRTAFFMVVPMFPAL